MNRSRAAVMAGLLACSVPLPAQQERLYAQSAEQIYQQALNSMYSYFGTGPDLTAADRLLMDAERQRLQAAQVMVGRAELKYRTWQFYDHHVELRADALLLLYKAFETDDKLPQAYALLGQIEWSEGCVLCAKVRAVQALRRDRRNADGLFLSAIAHASVRDYASADRFLQEAVGAETRPLRSAHWHVLIARVLASQKRLDEAERLLREANKLAGDAPQRAWFRSQLANFLLYERGKPVEALIEAKLAAKSGIGESKVLIDLASYLEWAQRYLKVGSNPAGFRNASVTGYLTVEHAFVKSSSISTTTDIARAMLKARAIDNVDAKDGTSNTALIGAAKANDFDLAKQLIAKKAAVNAQNDQSERALTFFVAAGNVGAARFLIERGAAVNYADMDGSSPLSIAIVKGDAQMVKLLLGAKAEIPRSGYWSGARLLIAAAQSGNLDIVKTLLARGLDVNAKDQYGQTPLIAAILAGQRDAVKYLLEHKANTEARFMRGSALDHALEIGDQEIIRLLQNATKLAA